MNLTRLGFDSVLFFTTKFPHYRGGPRGELIVDCLRCGRPKLYVNYVKEVFNCFRCEWGGSLDKLVMEVLDVKGRAALLFAIQKWIPKHIGFRKPAHINVVYKTGIVDLPKEFIKIGSDGPMEKVFKKYLLARNITTDIIAEFGIGYCLAGKMRGRIVIPFTKRGEIVGFSARAINIDVKPKYHTEGPKGGVLLGLDQVKGDYVVICEGPFDALRIKNAVALQGNTITDEQLVQLLTNAPDYVIVFMDNDNVGRKMAMNLCRKIWQILPTSFTFPPDDKKDPGEMTNMEIRIALKNRKPYNAAVEFDVLN